MQINYSVDSNRKFTKADIIKALEGVPDEAVVDMITHDSNYGSSMSYTLKITFTKE